jgi:hypothetical protein
LDIGEEERPRDIVSGLMENTCEVRVGRLMEIRVDRGFQSIADVEEMRGNITRAFATIAPDVNVVIAADWRRTRLMDGDAADAFGKMIGFFNARIERSGILSSPESPTTVLQFLRVVRESKHPNRRLFDRLSDLTAYLDDLLTPEEKERLAIFLAP